MQASKQGAAVGGATADGVLALSTERGAQGHGAVRQRSRAAGVSDNLVRADVQVVRFVGCVRYRHQPHCREGLDGAQHVEHDTASAALVEAKVLPSRSREQPRSAEHLQVLDLKMICRDVVSWVPLRRREDGILWVVATAGEPGKGLVGVSRAAHAQVHLERERLPAGGLVPDDEEIDREPADRSSVRATLRDSLRERPDDRGIRPVGGESTARELLGAATVKDLVVRGKQRDYSSGCDLELHAWAAEVAPSDALFHDSTVCSELAQVSGWADAIYRGDQALEPLLDELTLAACARCRQFVQVQ